MDTITAGLSEELEQRIIAAIRAPPINSSKSHSDLYYGNDVIMTSSDVASVGAIKEQLPAEVEYWHIKITISLLQVCADYKRPGNNKAPSNSKMGYKNTGNNKRHLPTWTSYKPTKRSKKFF